MSPAPTTAGCSQRTQLASEEPGSSGGSLLEPLFLKLLGDAQDSMSVPSTVKCSAEIKPRCFATATTRSKRIRDIGLKQTIAVLRERSRIEARVVEVHPEEEAKQEVVVEAFAELPLASEIE